MMLFVIGISWSDQSIHPCSYSFNRNAPIPSVCMWMHLHVKVIKRTLPTPKKRMTQTHDHKITWNKLASSLSSAPGGRQMKAYWLRETVQTPLFHHSSAACTPSHLTPWQRLHASDIRLAECACVHTGGSLIIGCVCVCVCVCGVGAGGLLVD